jgi:imidazolonepropionase-like amidohydrolase
MSLRRIRIGKPVDGTGAGPLEDAAVLIDGERIVALGPDASVPSPDSAERLDFSDRTLLPGLVDCHSHLDLPGDGTTIEGAAALGDDLLLLQSAENARTTLKSGVTSLRDNGASHHSSDAATASESRTFRSCWRLESAWWRARTPAGVFTSSADSYMK